MYRPWVSFPTVNASVYQDADHLQAGSNLIYGDVPHSIATDRFGGYNDVIFGAMGIATQDTTEATIGTVMGTQHTVTATLTSNLATGRASMTCASACFSLSDVGLDISDGNINVTIGTYIYAFVSATNVTLSTNPVANEGPVSITVGPLHGYFRPTGSNAFNNPRLEKIQTTSDILSLSSTSPQNHGNDTLYGNGGDNVLVGGDGNNNIEGGPGRNLIIGGSVLLDRTTHLFNYKSGRFQDLTETQIYITSLLAAGMAARRLDDRGDRRDDGGHERGRLQHRDAVRGGAFDRHHLEGWSRQCLDDDPDDHGPRHRVRPDHRRQRRPYGRQDHLEHHVDPAAQLPVQRPDRAQRRQQRQREELPGVVRDVRAGAERGHDQRRVRRPARGLGQRSDRPALGRVAT